MDGIPLDIWAGWESQTLHLPGDHQMDSLPLDIWAEWESQTLSLLLQLQDPQLIIGLIIIILLYYIIIIIIILIKNNKVNVET